MSDFLLELRSEEIPARMQIQAKADLARLFEDMLANYDVRASAIETFATPRRLALIANGLPEMTAPRSTERKGPRADAPAAAVAGFCRSAGLPRDGLVERDGTLFAVIEKPGEPLDGVLAAIVNALVIDFPWPKSMRWGAASRTTESLRWVRPLQGIVAIFGEQSIAEEIGGIPLSYATLGHRFHHPGPITIGGAHDYVEKLRACHVILHFSERCAIIRDGARVAAEAAGLALVEDEGLVAENAGLTEWPVPLLGRFDAAFLEVPQEIIQLTARVNQKYFVCSGPHPAQASPESTLSPEGEGDFPSPSGERVDSRSERGEGDLANAFILTANIDAPDGGAAIVDGNRKVLAARLADAKFFWDNDLKVPLVEQAAKLDRIVFHEKLGTVADKVERVAKLARWLVTENIVTPAKAGAQAPDAGVLAPGLRRGDADLASLADQAERAARLCKADLVTGTVGEFPELQGVIGGHLARARGEDDAVADAIRDHYKPVGQGDDVPTAPVTVAVSLADKLDTIALFFAVGMPPSGSKDPYALRRAALGIVRLVVTNDIRVDLQELFVLPLILGHNLPEVRWRIGEAGVGLSINLLPFRIPEPEIVARIGQAFFGKRLRDFFADRLKVQQREAGVRHDLIDAVFALGGEDDLVRLLARVRALQAFVETGEGADLLAGYKRAANIWKKLPSPSGERDRSRSDQGEGLSPPRPHPAQASPESILSPKGEGVERVLSAALDAAEPLAAGAIGREDFAAAMAALASLRAPIDAFFEGVMVNDPDPAVRTRRLALLARFRDAVHTVADFSKIEG